MAKHKLSGNEVILGGANILTAPTIYAAGSYNLLTTSSTGVFKIYGVPVIENTTTDKQVAEIKKAGLRYITQKCPFTFASWTTALTSDTDFDTGKDIPAGGIVKDAWFDIHTAATSGTLTAGTDLDPDGFLTGINPQTAVPVVGALTAGAVTFGALLVDQLNTTIPSKARVDYIATSAKNIMIGRSATTVTGAVVADLYVEYVLPATS